jgi:hypothetical protein
VPVQRRRRYLQPGGDAAERDQFQAALLGLIAQAARIFRTTE